MLLTRISAERRRGRRGQAPSRPQMLQTLEERIVSLSGVLAAAERIKGMPVPYTYSLMLHRTAYLFCLLLPFGLAAAAGPWTPLLVLIVSYTFFGLDALGDELENPFGSGQNALPLSAMTRGIDIDLREMMGDTTLAGAATASGFHPDVIATGQPVMRANVLRKSKCSDCLRNRQSARPRR